MTQDAADPARGDRCAALEAFVRDADAWAESLELVGRAWGDLNGRSLAAYAASMRARIRPLLQDAAGD